MSIWTISLHENKLKIENYQSQQVRLKQQLVLSHWFYCIRRLQHEYQVTEYLTDYLSKRYKRGLFQYWRKQRFSLFELRKFVFNRNRKGLKRRLKAWRHQLRLLYYKGNRAFTAKVTVLRCLRSYALQSAAAQRVLTGVKHAITAELGKTLLRKWQKGCVDWKITRKIEKLQQNHRGKAIWQQWRSALLLKSRIYTFKSTLKSHCLAHYLHYWQLAQRSHSIRALKWSKVLLHNLKRHKKAAISTWQSHVYIQNRWQTLQFRVVFPAKARLLSLIFLSWRYEYHRKALLQRIYERYQVCKARQLMINVLQAFRTMRRSRIFSETLAVDRFSGQIMRFKRKILKKWKMFTEKRVNLRNYGVMIERRTRKCKLSGYMTSWGTYMRQLQALRRLISLQSSKFAFKHWSSILISHHKALSLANINQIYRLQLTSQAFCLWLSSTSFLSELEERVDLYLHQKQEKMLKLAMRKLCFSLRIPREYRRVAGDVERIKAKRWFGLLKKGCEIAQIQQKWSAIALDHFTKQLLTKIVLFWRIWRVKRTEKTAKTARISLKATKYHRDTLIQKGFTALSANRLACARLQGVTRRHSIFSAWRQHTREMQMLKKYLVEVNFGR
jgi:hypothetical protein